MKDEVPGQMGTPTNANAQPMGPGRDPHASPMLDAALDYATRLHWRVFPVATGKKNPLTSALD